MSTTWNGVSLLPLERNMQGLTFGSYNTKIVNRTMNDLQDLSKEMT